jgi:DNA mismatch repair ATPase MutL
VLYLGKGKRTAAIFINERSPEHETVIRGLECVYPSLQFVFGMLTMPQENADVNVHPAKRTVMFLDRAQ